MFDEIYAAAWLLALTPLILALTCAKSSLIQIYTGGLFFVAAMLARGGIEEKSSHLNYVIYVFISNLLLLITLITIQSSKLNINIVNCKSSIEKRQKKHLNTLLSTIYALLACIFLIYGAGGTEKVLSEWTQVGEELSENTGHRILSMTAFIVSIAHIIIARENNTKLSKLYPAALLLIAFSLLIRVKIFIVPVVFSLIIPIPSRRFTFTEMLSGVFLLLISYLLVMFFRWLGDFESLSQDNAVTILFNISDAGVERELYHQFTSVMQYYEYHTSQMGASYMRILIAPIDYFFNTKFAPDNPMYKYYEIYSGAALTGGSAHPTIYADSYADFYHAGIFIPSLYLIIFWVIENLDARNKIKSFIISSSFLALPLIIRGSTFYGIFYIITGLILGILLPRIYAASYSSLNK